MVFCLSGFSHCPSCRFKCSHELYRIDWTLFSIYKLLVLVESFCSKGEGCSKPSPRVPTSRRAIGTEFCQDRIAVEAFIVAAKINKQIAVHASLSRHQLLPLYCIVPALALVLVLVPALALALVLVLEWY